MNALIEPTLNNRKVICLTRNKKYLVMESTEYYQRIEDALIGQPVDFYPLFFCGNNEPGYSTYIIRYMENNKIKYRISRAKRIESVKEWFADNNPTITERWITDLTPYFNVTV